MRPRLASKRSGRVNKSLEAITLPNSLTEIKEQLFCECESLRYINIPKAVTCIESHAFFWCASLSSICIPSNVKKIGHKAFWGCLNVISIIVPKSVKQIDKFAFGVCLSLLSISLPTTSTQFGRELFGRAFDVLHNILDDDDGMLHVRLMQGYSLEDAILGRFAKLPMHEECYHDLSDMTPARFTQLLKNHESSLDETDGIGMTPMHVLCCNPTAKPELINAFIQAYPQSLSALQGKDAFGKFNAKTPYMLFLSSRGLMPFLSTTSKSEHYHGKTPYKSLLIKRGLSSVENDDIIIPSIDDLLEMGVKARDLKIIFECFPREIKLHDLDQNDLMDLMVKAVSTDECELGVVYYLTQKVIAFTSLEAHNVEHGEGNKKIEEAKA